jgi:hypothetical protein
MRRLTVRLRDPPSSSTITMASRCWQNSSTVLHTVTDDSGAFDTNLR